MFVSRVSSYTHGIDYEITISKSFLDHTDNVLLVDDFMSLAIIDSMSDDGTIVFRK